MSAPEPMPVAAEVHQVTSVRNVGLRITVLVVLIAVAASVAVVLSRPSATGPVQIGPSSSGVSADVDQMSRRMLTHLESALRSGDRAAFIHSWSRNPTARAQASDLFHNLTALDARIDFGAFETSPHVDANSPSVTSHWDASVEVRWGLRAIDRGQAATRVSMELTANAAAARVVAVTAAPSIRQPIWLLGHLAVRRGPNTVTAATNGEVARQVQRLLQQASGDVRNVDQRWRGSLTAYVPASRRDFEAMVGADPGQYDNIAGITSSVDGSAIEASPQMIAINPDIFAALSARGRHVVITHEATHLATGAANSAAPDWLIEGYADYVAIRAARVPVAAVAASLPAHVEAMGRLAELPSDTDFSSRHRQQQRTAYTLSWMAVRMLANAYGENRVTACYREILANPKRVEQALRAHLSTSLDDVTREWRISVRRLADGA